MRPVEQLSYILDYKTRTNDILERRANAPCHAMVDAPATRTLAQRVLLEGFRVLTLPWLLVLLFFAEGFLR